MMILLIINLNMIFFDWLFDSLVVQSFFKEYTPSFFDWYKEEIHLRFLVIDLYFVTAFLAELSVRSIIAIRNKTYYRWFFFPLVHWYDVLGCIPLGSFRFMRILRVVSIVFRLQRLQIIDITQSYLYGKFVKYLAIATEEISDRVVASVLDDIQDEINQGNPVGDRIINEVILPQKEPLVNWLSQRIQRISTDAHLSYERDIGKYVNQLIEEALDRNKAISNIERIPVFGSVISKNLERAISDIVLSIVSNIIHDLASTNNKVIVENLADLTLKSFLTEGGDEELNRIAKDVVLQAIEVVKEQVQAQQWKLRALEEEETRIKERLEAALAGGE